MSNSVGRIDLDLGLNYNQFNRELNGISHTATGAVGGAFKKLGLVIAGAFAVGAMVQFGRSAIQLASDLNEVQNVVDVTFGAMAEHVNAFSKNALAAFGMSELSAKRYVSTMGAMLKSSGLTGAAMTNMSENLAGLSGDFASFYNLSQDTAFEKIRSGISGETEPLKQLGINMSVTNMEAYALSQGITKSWMAMSQAEQILLRYNYLLSVSKDAQGDFARTSNSWANQTRLLSEQWKIFQGTMGQGFINILTPVVRGLNFLIAKLQIAAAYFKAFTELIFGAAKTTGSGTAAIGGLGAIAADAGGATGDLGGSLGGAGKAAKKAGKDIKGSLSGFDQLNTITQSAASALDDAASGMGGLGGAGAGGMGDLGKLDPIKAPEIFTPDLSKFKPLITMLDNIKSLSRQAGKFLSDAFGPPLRGALETLMPPLMRWKTTLKETFSQLGTLGAPFIKWLKGDFVTVAQQSIGTLAHILAGLLDTGNMVFTGIRDAAMPILTWFVTSGLPLISSFTSGALTVLQAMFDTAKIIFDQLWTGAIQPGLMLVSEVIVDVLDIIKAWWDKWGADIVKGVTDNLAGIATLFTNLWVNFLQPVVSEMLNTMKWLWEKHLKDLVTEIGNFIGKLITGVQDINNKFIMPIVNFLVKLLGPTFANIFKLIGGVLGTFIGVIADVAKGVFKVLGGIIDFIVGVFTGNWKKAWNGVKSIFEGIFDAVVGILKGAVNLIIDGVNFLIRSLNKIQVKVPGWVEDLTGMSDFGVNIPQIPKLAKGGLATAPTLAMVGDNRNARVDPEVISPLSKLEDMIMRTVAAAMAAYSNQNQGRQDVPTEVILKLGETELGRAVIKAINTVQRQTGVTLLNI